MAEPRHETSREPFIPDPAAYKASILEGLLRHAQQAKDEGERLDRVRAEVRQHLQQLIDEAADAGREATRLAEAGKFKPPNIEFIALDNVKDVGATSINVWRPRVVTKGWSIIANSEITDTESSVFPIITSSQFVQGVGLTAAGEIVMYRSGTPEGDLTRVRVYDDLLQEKDENGRFVAHKLTVDNGLPTPRLIDDLTILTLDDPRQQIAGYSAIAYAVELFAVSVEEASNA
jgi:hypothetical protein